MNNKKFWGLNIEIEKNMEDMVNGLQCYLRLHNQCFFADLDENEYNTICHQFIFSINGWLLPLEMEKEFSQMNKFEKKKNGKAYYKTIRIFHDFEGTGKWLYGL